MLHSTWASCRFWSKSLVSSLEMVEGAAAAAEEKTYAICANICKEVELHRL